MDAHPRTSSQPNRSREAGFSLVELIAVVAIVGIAAGMSAAAWQTFGRRSEAMQAARVSQKYLYQARMLAVYRGVNYFVVLDPTAKTIGLYQDSSSPFSKFDVGDTKVESEAWPASVSLALPPSVSSMPNPLGGSAISSAWSIALPDSSARWGTTLRGVMATPSGVIKTAESTPQTLSAGSIVFSDNTGQATSVGVRGQFGTVRSYRYDGAAWANLS